MVARGACVVALGGMHGCSWGGMCGCCQGVCMVAPGGHAWLFRGGCMVAPRGACMVAPGGGCGCCQGACVVAARGHAWLLLGGHAWDMMRYRDTINEWAVHILLECILVINTKNIRRCMCPSV